MRAGIGLTVAMQAMNGLDHLQPVEGMGPVGEIRLVPDPDTFRVLPVRAAHRRDARRPAHARRRGRAGRPARLPAAAWSAGSPSAARGSRSPSRTSSRSPTRDDARRVRPGRLEPVLLDDRHDRVAGLRRRARRRPRGAGASRSSSTTPSSGTASRRSRPPTGRRSARPTSSSSCARRSAASRPRTASSRRSRRSRGPRARATAATSTSRSGTPRSERNRFHDPDAPDRFSAEGRRVPRAACSHHLPGAVRADRAELQLLPADRAAVLGGRVHLLGPRQPRGAAAPAVAVQRHGGGLDEPRAEGRRRDVQPVPGRSAA